MIKFYKEVEVSFVVESERQSDIDNLGLAFTHLLLNVKGNGTDIFFTYTAKELQIRGPLDKVNKVSRLVEKYIQSL